MYGRSVVLLGLLSTWLCALPIYAAQPTKTPGIPYIFSYEKITTNRGEIDFFYVVKSIDTSLKVPLAYTKNLNELLKEYGLSDRQLQAIALGQESRIKTFDHSYSVDLNALSRTGLDELVRRQAVKLWHLTRDAKNSRSKL